MGSQVQDDITAYRAERARNWPSRINIERKERIAADRSARGELDLQAETQQRRKRLRDILAQQRGLGHFDASRELGLGELYDSSSRHKQQPVVPKPVDTEADKERRQRERDAAMARIVAARATAQRSERHEEHRDDEPPDIITCASLPPPDFPAMDANESQQNVKAKGKRRSDDKNSAQTKRPSQRSNVASSHSSILRKLLDKEIRLERSHLLQAFRFLHNSGRVAPWKLEVVSRSTDSICTASRHRLLDEK